MILSSCGNDPGAVVRALAVDLSANGRSVTRLAFVGPDYRSIIVTDTRGVVVTTLSSSDPRLSGRVAGPRWSDDDTTVYYDAVPALLQGKVSAEQVEAIAIYASDDEDGLVFPVLLVPLPR